MSTFHLSYKILNRVLRGQDLIKIIIFAASSRTADKNRLKKKTVSVLDEEYIWCHYLDLCQWACISSHQCLSIIDADVNTMKNTKYILVSL